MGSLLLPWLCCTLHFQSKYCISRSNMKVLEAKMVPWVTRWRTSAATVTCKESSISLDPLGVLTPNKEDVTQRWEELECFSLHKAPPQWSSPRANRHFGKGRLALLPVAPMEVTAMEQQPQQTSELYKKLAQRFVYAKLKIKFDLK